jgi:hypothetical protein
MHNNRSPIVLFHKEYFLARFWVSTALILRVSWDAVLCGSGDTFTHFKYPWCLLRCAVFWDCTPLKKKALWSFKMSGSVDPTTQHHIPED